MRRLGLILFLASASAATAQTRASRCWAACDRNVTDPRLRATACGACLTRPDDAAAWLARAPTPLPTLLADPDWEVRWAGLRSEATRAKGPPARQLAGWIGGATGEELLRACVTATHAAGAEKKSLGALLEKEVPALKSCLAVAPASIAALSTELYDVHAGVRREALVHLGRAFERSPARIVLDAVPAHPAAFDDLVLETLKDVTLEENANPASELLAAAGPGDVATMNRLLAVFSAQRDAARTGLASPELARRKEAMSQLASLSPLSEPELLDAVGDAEPALRLGAARGLARGERSSIAAMARRRFSGERPATAPQLLALLRVVGDTHEPDCAAVALETWRVPGRAPALRALALPVAASCRWESARPDVEAVLTSGAPGDLPAAIAALAWAPASEQLFERLTAATLAPRPEVRAAACESIASRRWRGGLPRVVALTGDADASVRAAALRGLVTLDAPGAEARVGQLLEADPAAGVRRVAAELLGRLGSPRALSALTRAARNDADTDVKLVAAQSLRRLGAGSLTP